MNQLATLYEGAPNGDGQFEHQLLAAVMKSYEADVEPGLRGDMLTIIDNMEKMFELKPDK